MREVEKEEWTYKRLDELGFVGRGKSRHRPRNDPSLYNGEYPFIQTADVKNAELYVRVYSQAYNERGLAQSKLWSKGTLCITIAANIAETAILGLDACFLDSIVGFIPNKEKTDVKFIKYYLDTAKIKMQEISKGTTQDNLSIDKLLTVKVLLPPLPSQRKIAAILSAYDDLIENNSRRIQILEEMAQAIYKEWFVKFRFPGHEKVKMVDSELGKIPEGWEVKNLFDLAEVTYGFPFKSKLFMDGPIGKPVIRIRNLKTNGTNTYTTEQAPKKHIVRNGDLLVGMDGDFYMCKWAGGEAYLNQRVVRFRPMNGLPFYFLFLALEKPIHFFDTTIVGTTVAHLSDEDLRSIELLVPNDALIEIMQNALDPLFDLELNLRIKNSTLRHTRDLLLPKLISGEVDIASIDISTRSSTALNHLYIGGL